MRNNGEVYLIKYKQHNSPYYRVVNGNFKYQESAMRKVDEIKKDNTVSGIIVNKRNGYNSAKVYSWDNGFEVSYLNRRLA